jgi:hypothetical protein
MNNNESKLKIIVNEFFYKSTEIILESRIKFKHSNKYRMRFNIETEDITTIRNSILPLPLLKIIILYNKIPIEQWQIQYKRSQNKLDDILNSFKNLYNDIGILLKTLYVKVRISPAHELKNKLEYTFIDSIYEYWYDNNININKYSFVPIDSIIVIYKNNIVQQNIITDIPDNSININIFMVKSLNIDSFWFGYFDKNKEELIDNKCIIDDLPFAINNNNNDLNNFFQLLISAQPLKLITKNKNIQEIFDELEYFKKFNNDLNISD